MVRSNSDWFPSNRRPIPKSDRHTKWDELKKSKDKGKEEEQEEEQEEDL